MPKKMNTTILSKLTYEEKNSERATIAKDIISQLGANSLKLANRTDCEVLVVVKPKGFLFTAPPTIFYSENMSSNLESMQKFLTTCMETEGRVTISTNAEHYKYLGVSGRSFKRDFGSKTKCAIPRSSQRPAKGNSFSGFSLPLPGTRPPPTSQEIQRNIELFERMKEMQQVLLEEIEASSTAPPPAVIA